MEETLTLEMPALVLMKAQRLVRTKKAGNFLDAIDAVLDDEYTFPIFCSFLLCGLRELEGSEVLRDEQRDLMQSYNLGTRKQERESNGLMVAHSFNQALQGVCKWFRNETCVEHLVVKMTENRAAYLMNRYASQRVARELTKQFVFDETTPGLLEEAKKRKLPGITKLLQTCIDLPYLFAQKKEDAVSDTSGTTSEFSLR